MEKPLIQKKLFAIKTRFLKEINKRPDLDALLFIIGAQESGILKNNFSKEEKQDLIHVAVCTFLEKEGYCKFEGRDDQDWPHWKTIKTIPKRNIRQQKAWLQHHVVLYFEDV